ncbi:MAG: hypothetical protein DI598_05665 [Pseudopedobacter saltans]|uniref:RagB/SusD family nutrient uptake outer membrane protein n=1 Tax=Pseudopedobacter saltans TaxID=151895 RepID=A0A2W5F2H4_9SPHI|nr:MAG: hypothetical protein DI598_05665 [Pseudopedobacter saltans]
MKLFHIKISAATFAILLSLSACNKQLDKLRPHNVTEEEALFSTEEGFQRAVEGIYSMAPSAWGDNLIMIGEASSNNLRRVEASLTDNSDVFTYRHLTMDIWTSNYKVIQHANLILSHQNDFPNSDIVKQAVAEAYFARAFSYFNLVRAYGRPYAQDPTKNLGAILVLESDDNGKRGRNTVEETYQQIIKDLEVSIPLFTNDRGSSYASVDGAKALLSRVFLYMGGTFDVPIKNYNDSVVKYTTTIIESGKYQLAEGEDYVNYYKNQNTDPAATEDIFAVNTQSTTSSLLRSIFSPVPNTYAGLYPPSPDLLELLKSEPGDLRLQLLKKAVFRYSSFDDDTLATIKYEVSGTAASSRYSRSPIRHLRLVEMYLNRAEANFKLGNFSDALEDLNVVRNRAGLGSVTLSGAALSEAIFDQRRLEFAFEGQTGFDYFRDGLTMTRNYSSAPISGIPDITEMKATDPRVVLRIPLAEILINSQLQQNEQ